MATWNIASRGFGSCRREYSLDEFIWYFHQRGPMDPALVEQSMTLLPRRSCRISDKGQLARVRLLVGPYGGRDPHRSDGLIPRSPKCKFGPDLFTAAPAPTVRPLWPDCRPMRLIVAGVLVALIVGFRYQHSAARPFHLRGVPCEPDFGTEFRPGISPHHYHGQLLSYTILFGSISLLPDRRGSSINGYCRRSCRNPRG